MRRFWTPADDQYLIDTFPNEYTKVIAEKLNRGYSSVTSRARTLGVKKSTEFIERMLKETSAHLPISGAKTRFKKGDIPVNKGQKMSDEVRSKYAHTFYPKGNKPHNTRTAGDLSDRVDSKTGIVYRYIKIEDNDWQQFHRFVWEQHNGPIPKGYRIHFKDGNALNCDINNLEMLTGQEAMDRNRITDLPVELQEVIRLKNKLNKKIRSYGKK